jgi:hypothetical protein
VEAVKNIKNAAGNKVILLLFSHRFTRMNADRLKYKEITDSMSHFQKVPFWTISALGSKFWHEAHFFKP